MKVDALATGAWDGRVVLARTAREAVAGRPRCPLLGAGRRGLEKDMAPAAGARGKEARWMSGTGSRC